MRVEFAEFVLDSASRQLVRDGEPVHLSRKAFDALAILIDRRPSAVTKEELHARLWPGTFVSEANLSVVIAEVRRALGDDPHAARFVRTIHRVGYAFSGDAGSAEAPITQAHQPQAWLAWNERVLPLVPGENLIGREPGCVVWLDATGVSRRHARITISDDTATIEDVGSKNGTLVNDVPLAEPLSLAEGDLIVVGDVHLQFRMRDTGPTKTVRLARTKR